ncbi:MAG: cysteine desulfurase family protein [archaeon]|jgi:cysteine desulfurase
MKETYLDYSSTTPTRKEALKEALPYFTEKFGNPSSFHSTGLVAKKAIIEARANIAKTLNCAPEEIIFTGSGTESINLALKGVAFHSMLEGKKGVFITQKTEHHAVLETLKWLERFGFNTLFVKVDETGTVDLKDLKKLLTENLGNVLMVSIMYANNEIGTIQPLKEISLVCHTHNTLFHTDACQGAEYLNLNVKELGVDLMTLNGSKVYAFKGTGLLYKKAEVKLEALIHGGAHEGGMRAGTENVPGIIALATALTLAEKEKKKESKRLTALRNYLIKKVEKEIPRVYLNGHRENRLPNNVNTSFEGVEGESILLRLNEKGIRISTGSACTSHSLDPSHVLLAIGRDHALAHGSIRFSLGKDTTKKQIDYTIKQLKETIEFLRKISPVWGKNENELRRMEK